MAPVSIPAYIDLCIWSVNHTAASSVDQYLWKPNWFWDSKLFFSRCSIYTLTGLACLWHWSKCSAGLNRNLLALITTIWASLFGKCNQEYQCYSKKVPACPNPSSNSQYSWWLIASPHALSKSLETYVFGIFNSTTGRNDHILVLLWWRKMTGILLYITAIKFQKSRT